MEEIKEILGSSCNTYFKMTNGQIFVASSEFRAKSGEIDGFIVYRQHRIISIYKQNHPAKC